MHFIVFSFVCVCSFDKVQPESKTIFQKTIQ